MPTVSATQSGWKVVEDDGTVKEGEFPTKFAAKRALKKEKRIQDRLKAASEKLQQANARSYESQIFSYQTVPNSLRFQTGVAYDVETPLAFKKVPFKTVGIPSTYFTEDKEITSSIEVVEDDGSFEIQGD